MRERRIYIYSINKKRENYQKRKYENYQKRKYENYQKRKYENYQKRKKVKKVKKSKSQKVIFDPQKSKVSCKRGYIEKVCQNGGSKMTF
jgi:hypothetical protein